MMRLIARCHSFEPSITIGGDHFIQTQAKYTAQNYHPVPVILTKGKGVEVWDTAGTRYLDFLAGYSGVNQGHCHPHITAALQEQSKVLTLTSRAFHSDTFIDFIEIVSGRFGYDKCLMMNTGCEATETAVKLARLWGYKTKGIPENQAKVVFCNGNFWGRSLAACGSSDDPERYENFGPFNGLEFYLIDFNNVEQLEATISDPKVAAFVLEPIQGEAGVVIPDDGYLRKVRELCDKYNVLMVADEVQTGIGRTGKNLACDWEDVRPDILSLGKSLSGGLMPISMALANNAVMDLITPGTHGSTFGGNPLACAVAKAALEVVENEGLIENAAKMGEIFRQAMSGLKGGALVDYRGRGLMNAIMIDESKGKTSWDFALECARNGLLCKPAHENILRLTPPLVINEGQMAQACEILAKVLKSF